MGLPFERARVMDVGDHSSTRYGWAMAGGQCAKGTYEVESGAYEEGATLHLSSGVVLDEAAAFDRSPLASPAVVPTGGALRVDANGVVVSLYVPIGPL